MPTVETTMSNEEKKDGNGAPPPAPKEPKKTAKAVNANAALMARAKAAILKSTGQKPLTAKAGSTPCVSTGSLNVDYLIGGTAGTDGKPICPGFPRRHITEVYGPESSGKTTLLLSSIASVQRAGGTAFFIDFEHAIDSRYAKALGVSYDEDKFLAYQPHNLEDGLKMIYVGIGLGIDLIGIDSVAGMVPKDELLKSFDDPARVGALARALATVLPKMAIWLTTHPQDENKKPKPEHQGSALVFLNQTRALIQTGGGGGHGDNENTSGGKALKFFSYLRLRTSRIKSEVIERMDPLTGKKRRFAYGNLTAVKVIKSKIDGKQGHDCNVFIRYGYGIDNYLSVIETAVVQKIVRKDGSRYTFNEEQFHGKDKFRQFLISNPKKFDDLRAKVGQAIMSNAQQAIPDEELDETDRLLEGYDGDMEDVEGAAETVLEEVVEGGSEIATE